MLEPNLLSTVYKQFHNIAKEVTGEELMLEDLINKHAHLLDEKLDIDKAVQRLKDSVVDKQTTYVGSDLDLMCILHDFTCVACPFYQVCEDYAVKLDKYSHYTETMTAHAKVLMQKLIFHVEGTLVGDSMGILAGDSNTYN